MSALLKKYLYLLGSLLLCFESMVSAETPISPLGWVHDPKQGICEGYYVDELIDFQPTIPSQDIELRADQVKLFETKPSHYIGHVHLIQKTRELRADQAITILDPKTKALNTISIKGNIKIHQSALIARAAHGEIDIPEQKGSFYDVIYRLLRYTGAPPGWITINEKKFKKVEGLSAQGRANRLSQTSPSHYTMDQATYSTCSPEQSSWEFSAKKIVIDENKKKLTAYSAWLAFQHIPILPLPWISFSYDQTRKSGFLMPLTQYSSASGIEIAVPFYWNIAPHYDWTIMPHHFEQRGFRLDNNFSYMTWQRIGNLYFTYMPTDNLFDHFKETANSVFAGNAGLNRLNGNGPGRGLFIWKDQYIINPYWMWSTDINYVSDDYYFQDFSSTPSQITQNQLVQQSRLTYNDRHWSFNGLFQNYETLHPVNTAIDYPDQYARWPELDLSALYPEFIQGIDFSSQFQYVNFQRPLLPNNYRFQNSASNPYFSPWLMTAERINIQPAVATHFYRPWGYLTPQIEWIGTGYKINNLSSPLYAPHHTEILGRALPVLSIDSGLYFDRKVRLFNSDYIQTLEPRFFYLWVPSIKQDRLPILDTAQTFFSYESLFQTNPFTGIDRISNANQLSWGATSRFLKQETGFNQLDISLGEIVYFANRTVSLLPNQSPTDASAVVSPIAGQIAYHITPTLTLSGNSAVDPTLKRVQTSAINLNWGQDERHLFNLGYAYGRYDALDPATIKPNADNNINQVLASFYWPLTPRWNVIAALNYNANALYTQNYLAGLEYDTCCWGFRAMATQNFLYLLPTNTPVYNTSYYLQWIFKGLTSFNLNHATDLLYAQIPGYTDRLSKYY